jgi:hypothetical protein
MAEGAALEARWPQHRGTPPVMLTIAAAYTTHLICAALRGHPADSAWSSPRAGVGV